MPRRGTGRNLKLVRAKNHTAIAGQLGGKGYRTYFEEGVVASHQEYTVGMVEKTSSGGGEGREKSVVGPWKTFSCMRPRKKGKTD